MRISELFLHPIRNQRRGLLTTNHEPPLFKKRPVRVPSLCSCIKLDKNSDNLTKGCEHMRISGLFLSSNQKLAPGPSFNQSRAAHRLQIAAAVSNGTKQWPSKRNPSPQPLFVWAFILKIHCLTWAYFASLYCSVTDRITCSGCWEKHAFQFYKRHCLSALKHA